MKIIMSRAETMGWSCLELHEWHRKHQRDIIYTDQSIDRQKVGILQASLPDDITGSILDYVKGLTCKETEIHALKDAAGAFVRRVYFLTSRARRRRYFQNHEEVRAACRNFNFGKWEHLETILGSIMEVRMELGDERYFFLLEPWLRFVHMWTAMSEDTRSMIPGQPMFMNDMRVITDVVNLADDDSVDDDDMSSLAESVARDLNAAFGNAAGPDNGEQQPEEMRDDNVPEVIVIMDDNDVVDLS